MKKNQTFRLYSVLLMGMFMLFAVSCGNDIDDPDPIDNEPGTVVDIDGNTYKTVTIGKQEWMAENLRTTKFRDGSNILYLGEDTLIWYNNNTPAYSWYGGDEANKQMYGALYNWYAVRNASSLCPEGWRIHSINDWNNMVNYLMTTHSISNEAEDTEAPGKKLKSCRQLNSPKGGDCDTGVHPRWDPHIQHFGTDDYGFAALPGGYRTATGSFHGRGSYALWWTNSEVSVAEATVSYLTYNYSKSFGNPRMKNNGHNVRCMRDIP
jgi:uncharacterized protein (TIGR02145 family)